MLKVRKIASGIRWIEITVTYTFHYYAEKSLLAVKIFQMTLLRSAGSHLGGWLGEGNIARNYTP